MFPRTRNGRAFVPPSAPWRYSGRMLSLGYRSELWIGDPPVEELTRLAPREPIAGCRREVAMSRRSGTTLARPRIPEVGESPP